LAIAKMRRVFIVGLNDEKERTLRVLQDIGVLHVEPFTRLSSAAEEQNTHIAQNVRRIGQIYESLKDYRNPKEKSETFFSGEEILLRAGSILERLQELKNRKQTLEKLITELSVWGDFDTDYLKALEEQNLFIQRFRAEGVSQSEQVFPEDVFVQTVSHKPALLFFTIRMGHPVDLPWAVPLRRPEKGLEKVKEEYTSLVTEESKALKELSLLASRIDALRKVYFATLSEVKFRECLGSLYADELLFGVQGWLPADGEKDFFDKVTSTGLAITISTRDPLENETPPTLFKNNRLIRRIEPLLKLYGFPGYRDLDPSYFFAPFMILFFGICLGDAGYGIVFLVASMWIKKRFGHLSPSLPMVLKLCEAFSISAIIIGLLTGSIFGHWIFPRQWIAVDLDKDHGNPMILFYASLGLGVIHLSLSYVMGIFQSLSRFDRFQKVGLLCVLWGGACLISQRIWFSDPVSALNQWLHYSGVALVALGVVLTFLFTSDSKKLIVRLGLGLWGIYGLTGLVGDLLSYARLFGLGIATTAIAAVMNDLAGMVHRAAGPVAGSAFAVFILILGHTFNLLLSILGSTVHSARLHFVEAFKSFFQGGGTEYKPFKVERG